MRMGKGWLGVFFIGCRLAAAPLFDPASGEGVFGGGAPWLPGTDLRAVVRTEVCDGRPGWRIGYTGSRGIGVVRVTLKSPASLRPDGEWTGLRMEIGGDGAAGAQMDYFVAFGKRNEWRGTLKLAPGVHFLDTRGGNWRNPADPRPWTEATQVAFYLRESHIAQNGGRTPDWWLGRISAVERVAAPKLTAADLRKLSYTVDLRRDAVAVLPADPELRAAAEAAAAELERVWKTRLRRTSEAALGVTPPPGNYLLFSNTLTGPLTDRMTANGLIAPLEDGFVIRTVPNLFSAGAQVLYVGAVSAAAVRSAAAELVRTDGVFRNYLRPAADAAAARRSATAALAELKRIYAADSRVADRNLQAMAQAGEIGAAYHRSFDPEVIAVFREALRLLTEHYPEECRRLNGQLPSFHFPKLITAAQMVDSAPELSDSDRVMLGEQLRLMTQQIMDYWEMRPVLAGFQEDRVMFHENHELFACRSVVLASQYLKMRFDISAADYFEQAARHGFEGADRLKIGPEDAGGYQFICRMHWLEICQRLGLNYDTPNLRYYTEFVISQINQMGYGPSYGDDHAFFGSFYGWNFLLAAVRLRNDRLAAYLLGKQAGFAPYVRLRTRGLDLGGPVGGAVRQLGLSLFPMEPELHRYYRSTGLNRRPTLHKAVFRNGFEEGSSYLLLGGMNSPDPHSHRDANGILQYSRGRHYWLIDCGYIEKMPYFQNVVQITRDGEGADLRSGRMPVRASFAEIDGAVQAPDGRGGLLATSLREYNGADWTRCCFWTPEHGFWVIDQVTALRTGDFVLRRYWQVLGRPKQTGTGWSFTQKPSGVAGDPVCFALSRGDSATVRQEDLVEDSLAFPGTTGYAPADGEPTRRLRESWSGTLERGERRTLVDYFSHPAEGEAGPEIRRLGESVFWADGALPQLAAVGPFRINGIEAEVDRLLLTPELLLADGVKSLVVGGRTLKPDRAGQVALRGDFAAVLRNLRGTGAPVTAEEPAKPDLPEFEVIGKHEFSSRITALATLGDRVAVGGENGEVLVFRRDGAPCGRAEFDRPIQSLCGFSAGNRAYWAVGTRSDAPDRLEGQLALLAGDGDLLWRRPVEPQDRSPGNVNWIAPLSPGVDREPILVCGQFNGQVSGWDLSGRKLWRTNIFHGSCMVGAVGDFNGDGREEVTISERWRTNHLLDAEGRIINSVIRTIGCDRSALAADLDGDGRSEVLFGNDDGWVRAMGAQPKYRMRWELNAGGRPLAIAALEDGRFAAAVDNNRIVFFSRDGKRLPGDLRLPEELASAAADGGRLAVCDASGTVYGVTAAGVIRKLTLPEFHWDNRFPVLLKWDGPSLLVGSGRTLYRLRW